MQGSMARWFVVALAGGAVCLVGDHLHVMQGVLFYPHPVLWDQAWWVLPEFFLATLALLAVVRTIYPRQTLEREAPTRAAIADFFAFFTAYAFTAFSHAMPTLVLLVLAGFWVARVARDPRPGLILFCLLVAVAGPCFEAAWSALGMFAYRDPDIIGVPRWLPFLYLHAAVAASSARRAIDYASA